MEMTGEQIVPAPQQDVWNALNDPEILKQSVPGCESIEAIGENAYQVLMVARVGPVSAKFKGKMTLSDIKPPESYSLAFEGQGGAAGFAKGSANVRLSPEAGNQTRLAYDVKANVGGKLAQIGSRLVDAAAKKVADDFFKSFNSKVGELYSAKAAAAAPAPAAGAPASAAAPAHDHGHGPDHNHDHAGHDHAQPGPVPRDPDLPSVSNTTLGFFAAGVLVVVVVALFVLLG